MRNAECGMWEVASDVRTREASISRGTATHFGKGAADINLFDLTFDP